MGRTYPFLRALSSLLLGAMVLIGFGSLIVLDNLKNKLLNPEFYETTISAEDTYNRIHSEILPVIGQSLYTTSLLENIPDITSQEMTALLQELITPSYIQKQLDESINQIIGYINDDKSVLYVYIDVDEPLNNVKPVTFAFIDEKIDNVRLENPGVVDCSQTGVNYLITRYLDDFDSLSNGAIPAAIPSLHIIEPVCRRLLFDSLHAFLIGPANLDAQTIQTLRENRDPMRALFISGETRDMLKAASRILAESLVDESINIFRNELANGKRINLIRELDEWHPTLTETQIMTDLSDLKIFISNVHRLGFLISWCLVICGILLMGFLFWPYLSSMLRWPGLVFLITGILCFLTAKIAEHEIPNRLELFINEKATQMSDIPDPVTDLSSDILLLFGTRLTYGMTSPALTLIIIGGCLFGASFFTSTFKRLIPFIK